MKENEVKLSSITLVEKQKRNKHRYNIYLDEEFAFSVHEDIMIKHRLLKGERIHSEQVADVLRDEERNNAYMKALRMIGRRPHSSKEVKRKLKEHGFEEPVIIWTCEILEQQNYLNDEQFAKMWAEYRIYSQRKGRNFVRQELQQKGVNKEIVKEVMNAINPDEEYEGALKIAEHKWGHTKGSSLERKRKTYAYMMRRGYSNSIVSKILSQIASKEGDFEKDLDEQFEESFDD